MILCTNWTPELEIKTHNYLFYFLDQSNKLRFLICSQRLKETTFQNYLIGISQSKTLNLFAIISPPLDFRLEGEFQIELKTRLKVLINLLLLLAAARFRSLNKFIWNFDFSFLSHLLSCCYEISGEIVGVKILAKIFKARSNGIKRSKNC